MSATQMESAALDLTCQTCRGKGELYHQNCGHQGNCGCGTYTTTECPACDGSGRKYCDLCNEHPATEITSDLEFACRECWPAATTCGICERPVAEGWTIPLCPRCMATGKAIACQAVETMRFERDFGAEA